MYFTLLDFFMLICMPSGFYKFALGKLPFPTKSSIFDGSYATACMVSDYCEWEKFAGCICIVVLAVFMRTGVDVYGSKFTGDMAGLARGVKWREA